MGFNRPRVDFDRPDGLWSLWAIMHEFDAADWYLVTQLTTSLLSDAEGKSAAERFTNSDSLIGHLRSISEACGVAGLTVSAAVVRQQQLWVSTKESPNSIIATFGDVIGTCKTILDTVQAELASKLFFRLSDETAKYYKDKRLFGDEVETVFPSAVTDIEESGKCLALGRGTATVFHMMRVAEIGLKKVGADLNIPYAPSWESYTKQIGDKLAMPHSKKSIKLRKNSPFYREVLGDILSMKTAWRNPTMHIERWPAPGSVDTRLS
jgi:hypothetical protein